METEEYLKMSKIMVNSKRIDNYVQKQTLGLEKCRSMLITKLKTSHQVTLAKLS